MSQDPNIGRKLGHFLIQEKVGEGGMGAVYRAIQEGLDRPVAVKILQPGRASPTFLKRFLREAKSAAQVSHPNVVQVFTAGVADDVHYIAMEFVEGLTVGQLLDRRGRFEEREILSIAKQAATGLQAAARRGLVHRDVKPDNLILDRNATIKVADFGLAKDVESRSRLTEEKVAIGTIAYMSPEQIRGEKVDVRSDIYALGATLFHMATGRPPFVGEGAVVLAFKHLNEPPPLVREIAPAVSQGLEAVIHRMIAKTPADRHGSYEEVLADILSLASSGQPSSSQTYEFHRKLLQEAQAPVRSRRALLAIVGGLVFLAAAVLLSVTLLSGRDDGGPRPAPLPPRGAGLVLESPGDGQILPNPKVTVQGRADPETVAELRINGTPVALVAGRFTHEVWLDPARPRVKAEVLRRDGTMESVALSVVLDDVPPTLVLVKPEGGVLHTQEASAAVEGVFEDANPDVLRVDGAVVPLKGTRFALVVPLPAQGEKTLVVEGTDKAGHSVSIPVRLVRDTTKPVLAFKRLTRFVEGGDGTTVVAFEFDEPLARLTVNGEDLSTAGGATELSLTLKPGRNPVRIAATDLAGNELEHVEEIQFRPARPPTADERKKEYEETVLKALELAPEERVRLLERYVATHPGGEFNAAAEELIAKARVAQAEAATREAFEAARARAALAEDPFAAIAAWNDFLKGRTGPQADAAALEVEALRVKDLPEGIRRGDETGQYVNLRDGSALVRVPAGIFVRGLPKSWIPLLKDRYREFKNTEDETPSTRIRLDGYYIGRQEVTNGQFARFLEARGSDADGQGRPLVRAHEWGLVNEGGRWAPARGRERHPVLCVSWTGAAEYAQWAGGRLPTEAEWERAASWDEARGEKRIFPWGDLYRQGVAVTADLWFGEEMRSPVQHDLFHEKRPGNPLIKPQEADSFPEGASPCGCLHMAGNVAEWCMDVYDKEFFASQDSQFPNPVRGRAVAGSLRVVRGGAWKKMCRDARTTNRTGLDPREMTDDVGFRIVVTR